MGVSRGGRVPTEGTTLNVEDMTEEQLRAYVGGLQAKTEGKPWMREVKFEGETYEVDMRRLKSRAFLRKFAAVKAAKDDDAAMLDALDMLDYVFGEDGIEHVAQVVTAKLGYEDYEEMFRIESGILDSVDVKN
jgi:hypothetical protein